MKRYNARKYAPRRVEFENGHEHHHHHRRRHHHHHYHHHHSANRVIVGYREDDGVQQPQLLDIVLRHVAKRDSAVMIDRGSNIDSE